MKYTIENKKLGTILCTFRGSSKKYRQVKGCLMQGMKPCKYGIKYATQWVNYLNENGDDWELCEVEENKND